MPYSEKDCRKLYVTEFFFFWKILVTWGQPEREAESRRLHRPGAALGAQDSKRVPAVLLAGTPLDPEGARPGSDTRTWLSSVTA